MAANTSCSVVASWLLFRLLAVSFIGGSFLQQPRESSRGGWNRHLNFQQRAGRRLRDLLKSEATDARAAEAVLLFCYQVKKWIGAFAAALGGVDTLVFSGGIGESAPAIRARVCDGLQFLGIELDEERNLANEGVISAPGGRVPVRVIRTDEERMIAKTVRRVLHLGSDRET